MIDKQIIDLTEIDKKYKDKCSLIKAGKCKNVNIFIEQSRKLKAKEQECEGLRYEIGSLENDRDILQEQLDQLKAENEGFKILHKSDKGLITSTGKMNYQLIQEYDKLKTENNNIKETFDGLFKVQYKLADNNKKLRQCLTEIKEIAEKNLNIHTCAFKGCGYDLITKQILQEISECGVK